MANPTKTSSFPFILLSIMLYGMEVCLWLVQVMCLVVFPTKLSCTPGLSWGGRMRNREGFDTVQMLFSYS